MKQNFKYYCCIGCALAISLHAYADYHPDERRAVIFSGAASRSIPGAIESMPSFLSEARLRQMAIGLALFYPDAFETRGYGRELLSLKDLSRVELRRSQRNPLDVVTVLRASFEGRAAWTDGEEVRRRRASFLFNSDSGKLEYAVIDGDSSRVATAIPRDRAVQRLTSFLNQVGISRQWRVVRDSYETNFNNNSDYYALLNSIDRTTGFYLGDAISASFSLSGYPTFWLSYGPELREQPVAPFLSTSVVEELVANHISFNESLTGPFRVVVDRPVFTKLSSDERSLLSYGVRHRDLAERGVGFAAFNCTVFAETNGHFVQFMDISVDVHSGDLFFGPRFGLNLNDSGGETRRPQPGVELNLAKGMQLLPGRVEVHLRGSGVSRKFAGVPVVLKQGECLFLATIELASGRVMWKEKGVEKYARLIRPLVPGTIRQIVAQHRSVSTRRR